MGPKSEPKNKRSENKSEDLKEEGSPSGKPPLDEKMDPNSAGNHLIKMEPESEPRDKSSENKSEDLKEEGSTSGKPPLVKKEEEPHPNDSSFIMIPRKITPELNKLLLDQGCTFYTEAVGKNLPESLPSSLEDDSQPAKSERPEALKKSVNDNTDTSGNREAGNTALQRTHLSSYLENYMKGMRSKTFYGDDGIRSMKKILHDEYGKNAQTCTEVKMLKELMVLSDSVCQVIIDGRAAGSGFLLFDSFVLTNAHVVKEAYNEKLMNLTKEVFVHLSDLVVEVKKVDSFECTEEIYDWALLELMDVKSLPNGLFKKCEHLNQSDGVCIIGHRGGGVKRMDACLCIAPENPEPVLYKTTKLITKHYIDGGAESVTKTSVHGSSGCPVFDKDCNVLAMHSGRYKIGKKEKENVIEFCYPLSDIFKRMDMKSQAFTEFYQKQMKHVPKDT